MCIFSPLTYSMYNKNLFANYISVNGVYDAKYNKIPYCCMEVYNVYVIEMQPSPEIQYES